MFRDINDKKNLPENVTKLYAEYQALVRRQANHGMFWRWFHSAENDARTALINELRDTLQPYVPDIDLRSKTPTSPYLVAMAADEEAAVREINAGVSLDERDIPTVFGYDKERANNPLNNAQPKQLSEERKQILEQKKVADDIRAVYQDKLQEMKLAGVSVHELVEAEFEIAATGPSNFSVEVSERLEKIYKDQYMPNAIGKILVNAISNKEERRVLVNNIIDTVRRNMISLYSTAEENKINIFSLSESYKCLENTFKEVYRLTANCGYDFTNHIIVAPKITDEFMQTWSPANKSYLAEEMHCSGYFVGSSDMLQGVIPDYMV